MATYQVTTTRLSAFGGWPAGGTSTLWTGEFDSERAALEFVAQELDCGSVEELIADYADTYNATRSAMRINVTAI